MKFTSTHLRGSVAALAVASALQALLSIALLPVATLALTAADFGTYAILMSVVALAAALSDGGGALALPAHFGPADAVARRRMVATFIAVSGGLGLVVGLIVISLWPWKDLLVSYTLGIVPSAAIWLSCAALVPLRSLSATATVVFSVSGQGMMIATQIVVQTIAMFTVAVAALLVFDLGLLSLFLGAVAGQVFGLVIAARALRKDLGQCPSLNWVRVAFAHAPTAAAAGIVDGVRALAENALVAKASGLREVGYYAHAKLYYGIGITASNAVAQNVWPISLSEARETERRFSRTGVVWEAVHLAIFLAGFAAIALGDEIIALLTNDVLTPAAAYVPWLILLLLLNLSGRAAQATLYAVGHGVALARVRTRFSVATIAILPIVVTDAYGVGFSLGIAGLIGASISEAVVYRLYLRRRAAALGPIPFQDFWALVGALVIALAALLDVVTEPPLVVEFVALVTATAVAVIVDWARGGPVRSIAALRR